MNNVRYKTLVNIIIQTISENIFNISEKLLKSRKTGPKMTKLYVL